MKNKRTKRRRTFNLNKKLRMHLASSDPYVAHRLKPTLAEADFGQTLTLPSQIGVSVFWPSFSNKKEQQDEKTKHGRTNTRRVEPRRVGGPKFRSFFFSFPPQCSFFLPSFGVFSWKFGGVLTQVILFKPLLLTRRGMFTVELLLLLAFLRPRQMCYAWCARDGL